MDRTIQLLTDMWNRLQNEHHNVVTEENYDALKKAIKALEQTELKPSYNSVKTELDLISRQAVLDLIEHYNSDGLGSVFYGYEEGVKFADAVNKLPSVSTEKTALLKQVRWERDVAISQLHELGYEFGEKIEQQPCTDVISRQRGTGMTREEKAIIYFKDMRKRFCEDYLLGVPKNSVAYKVTMAEKEFYNTAIKALERESKLKEVIDTLQVWITTADDEFDREEMGRVCGLKEALHLIKKIDEQDEEKAESEDKDGRGGRMRLINYDDLVAKDDEGERDAQINEEAAVRPKDQGKDL